MTLDVMLTPFNNFEKRKCDAKHRGKVNDEATYRRFSSHLAKYMTSGGVQRLNNNLNFVERDSHIS